MSSTDTPLNTVHLLQEKQKADKVPYIVLSGGKGLASYVLKHLLWLLWLYNFFKFIVAHGRYFYVALCWLDLPH